jgi:HEAT repeat protein
MRSIVLSAIVGLLLPCLAAAQEAPDVADTTDLVNMTPEELLVRASSSALQYEALRKPARRLLVKRHEESVPYLVTRLDTDDVRERIAVENVLVEIGSPAVDPLIQSLGRESERDDTTRGARLAAGILGKIGDARAVAPLVEARGHSTWKVRASVAEALGRIGDAAAVPGLVDLIEDENEIVRKSAAAGLGRVAQANEDEAALDERAVEALAAALGDASYSVRGSAARALATTGERSVEKLVEIARNAGEPARILAIRALGEIGDRDAARPLRDLLDSESWVAAAHAAEALGRIGLSGGDRRALERVLEDAPHPFVAHKIELALEAEGR